MSAVRDDALIAVVQVREHLLIVLNKVNEIQKFHLFIQSILPMMSVQKIT